MSKNYAFISKDGILRLRDTETKAKDETANGKYLEVEIDLMNGGYPAWEVDGKVDGIIVYSETEMKLDAKKEKIKAIKELALLYSELK